MEVSKKILPQLFKFLKSVFTAALAFYLPVFIIYGIILMSALGHDEQLLHIAYRANTIIPFVISLYFYFTQKAKKSPAATLIGIWIGGPLSFVAGTYLGFLGALILATPVYLGLIIFDVVTKARTKKPS